MNDLMKIPGHNVFGGFVRIHNEVKWYSRCQCGYETKLANTPESALAIMMVCHLEELEKENKNNDTN